MENNKIKLTIKCETKKQMLETREYLYSLLSLNKDYTESNIILNTSNEVDEDDNNVYLHLLVDEMESKEVEFDLRKDKFDNIRLKFEHVVEDGYFIYEDTCSKTTMLMDDIAYFGKILFKFLDIVEIYSYGLDSVDHLTEIINKYKDKNVAIVTTAYVATDEYPENEYYLRIPEEGKKLLPWDEAISKRTTLLESLGFVNINSFIGYEYKIAYIYPSEAGKKILERINLLNESETEEEVQK